MIEILNERFSKSNNIFLNQEDVLSADLDEKIEELEKKLDKKFKMVKVVANLPYYITSPIIFKLLEDSKRIDEIIVMVQNEVADRILASVDTKDYGILTVMVDFYANSKKEILVKPSSFIPAPNVNSAVIRIKKEQKFSVKDEKIFKDLVHKAFANRRKKVINSLAINNFLNLRKEEIKNIFDSCKLSENTRAEQLTTIKYIELANMFYEKYH